MKRGRPTTNDTVVIHKSLLKHFDTNHSVGYAAEQEKLNIKTVQQYYKKFAEDLIEKVDVDFINHQKAVKHQTLIAMDKLIAKSQEQLENLEAKAEDDPENTTWESLKASVIKDQMLFLQEKSNLDITPTLDVDLDKIVEERLNENADTDPTAAK